MDRLLLMRPPKGGIPDPEYEDGETLILARVPIYGTQDAGRKFWKKFPATIRENGSRGNKIAGALYHIEKDGEVKGILLTHVDDLRKAVKPGYEDRVDKIIKSFVVRKVGSKFRFCGNEIEQDQEFTIRVTCEDTAETINPIGYTPGGRKPKEKPPKVRLGRCEVLLVHLDGSHDSVDQDSATR
jgi:hypothetical protein